MKYLTCIILICMTSLVCASQLDNQLVILEAAKAKVTQAKAQLATAKRQLAQQEAHVKELERTLKASEDEVARVTNIKDALAKDLTKSTEANEKLSKRQLQTGRERDVFLLAFAVAAGLSVLGLLRPLIAAIPPPYGWAAQIAAPIAVFVGAFYAGRLLVGTIVRMIF